MSALIVTGILRDWGGFRDYWEDALAKSPLNEFVDPPFRPSKPLTWTFAPPPRGATILRNTDIVEFERVDVGWMFGR